MIARDTATMLSIIEETTYFSIHGNRVWCTIVPAVPGEIAAPIVKDLHREDLTLLHPELFTALCDVERHVKNNRFFNDVPGMFLRCQVQHMLHPLEVPRLDGPPEYVHTMHRIVWASDAYFVRLTATIYRITDSCPDTDGTLVPVMMPFVCGEAAINMKVHTSWFDAQYRGWRQRYATGLAMGLDYDALANYVCSQNATPETLPLPALDLG